VTTDLVERLAPFASSQGITLDPDRSALLASFVGLLEGWNRRIRLTGDRDAESLVLKHCADSLVVASELIPGSTAVDVGSGAGFPGLVAACMRPEVDIVLVEARAKACGFLEYAAAALGLTNARVICSRIEEVARSGGIGARASTVVSRAVNVGPIASAMATLLIPGGVMLLMLADDQPAPRKKLQDAGFKEESERSYELPGGEVRRIFRHVRL
jgi:16S rRNA (guanine527-N7)-methyltransferase